MSYGTKITSQSATVLKKVLNMSPYKITKAQLLSQARKTKRLQRAKLLDGTQPPVFRIDEKLFTVQAVNNPQNNRIYAVNKSDMSLSAKHPSVMV